MAARRPAGLYDRGAFEVGLERSNQTQDNLPVNRVGT